MLAKAEEDQCLSVIDVCDKAVSEIIPRTLLRDKADELRLQDADPSASILVCSSQVKGLPSCNAANFQAYKSSKNQ